MVLNSILRIALGEYVYNKVSATLGFAYNEFGYNEHPAITSRFLCMKIVECNVKKFGCNEHRLVTSSFFCIFLLVVSGTPCIVNLISLNSRHTYVGKEWTFKKVILALRSVQSSSPILFCISICDPFGLVNGHKLRISIYPNTK